MVRILVVGYCNYLGEMLLEFKLKNGGEGEDWENYMKV